MFFTKLESLEVAVAVTWSGSEVPPFLARSEILAFLDPRFGVGGDVLVHAFPTSKPGHARFVGYAATGERTTGVACAAAVAFRVAADAGEPAPVTELVVSCPEASYLCVVELGSVRPPAAARVRVTAPGRNAEGRVAVRARVWL